MRVVSPASTPDRTDVACGVNLLTSWGLKVELGAHVFDSHGHYLAGPDESRLADVNAALRDPNVRAIFATRGGKGAYRIAHTLDFAAAARDPKPIVGFSEITILHLALWDHCKVINIHGPNIAMRAEDRDHPGVEGLRRALMEPTPVVIHRDPAELTARVTCEGAASGPLLGGNLDMIRTSVGWACPSFSGSILLLEAVDLAIGAIDRTLTQLLNSGLLHGVQGVALGRFIRAGEEQVGRWSSIDVLRDRLAPLGVPILGGLPIGHGPGALAVPIGAEASIDAVAGTLTVEPAVL